jgi:bacterioferritin
MAHYGQFEADLKAIRGRAREHMESGPVTTDYGGDVGTTIALLNEALATELVCVLRYKFHAVAAVGIHSEAVKVEFAQHAIEEQQHADRISQRINQLGGRPNLSPVGLADRSHSEYVEGDSLLEMIREDLVAERIAIETYREMVRYFGDHDPTTRRMMEEILAKEEEHANDMRDLLAVQQAQAHITH